MLELIFKTRWISAIAVVFSALGATLMMAVGAVSTILGDEATRNAMSKAGRELVLQTGSLQSMVDGYERMMQELYDIRVTSELPKNAVQQGQKAIAN